MTNEEAKRKVRGYLTDILPSDCSDEIDEIMKALEQQPTLDTRQMERQLEMEYQHGYDKGWKEGRKALEAQPTNAVILNVTSEGCWREEEEYSCGLKSKKIWWDDSVAESEDCRNCKKWNKCPCGEEGHENGTSIGYSIGECKDYEPYDDCISREAMLSLQTEYAEKMGATTFWKLRDDIRALPPVAPQRPKGKWIKIQSGDEDFPESIVCSRCKSENSHLDFNEHSEPIGKIFVMSKYCPNCGAYMSGGGENEDGD